jgi:hypothetical protein
MPIFQDDLGHDRATPPKKTEFAFRNPPADAQLRRKISEESIRTELCEGPVLEPSSHEDEKPQESENEDEREGSQGVSSRAELIERLKRGESPTWVPNRRVSLVLIFKRPRTLQKRCSGTSTNFYAENSSSLYVMTMTAVPRLESLSKREAVRQHYCQLP